MSNHTQLLLDTLSSNLPEESAHLLKDPQWNNEALGYLNTLLNSDDVESVLATKVLPESTAERATLGISEQIAELSNQSVLIDNKIFNCLNKSGGSNLSLVLDTSTTIVDSTDNFDNLVMLTQDLVGNHPYLKWKEEISTINNNLGVTTKTQVTQDTELSTILQNLQEVIEILELPAITHSLIKLGEYSQCIEISSLSKRLKIRYNRIGLVDQIDKNISFEINDMTKKLSALLLTNLRQSSMIKVLSYLKRINLDKQGLKSLFLHLRYKFIMDEFEILLPLKESKLIEKYLKRCLEVFREFCFQTIITFDSVFDKDPALINSFLVSLVHKLSSILNETLSLLKDDSIRDSLLLQLIYCCQSLNRVGGDFTLILLHEFSLGLTLPSDQTLLSIVKKQKQLVRSLNRV